MPSRWIRLAILLFWTYTAQDLFRNDLLPDLLIGPPPDLRAIAKAETPDGPTKWAILVDDDNPEHGQRSVGQIVTESSRTTDGWVRLTSFAWFDSGELLKGTPLETVEGDRFEVLGSCEIDTTGNLDNFRVSVRLGQGSRDDLMVLEGWLKNDNIEVTARGLLPLLKWKQTFPYKPRSLVQTSLGPLEQMPGLQIGQRWETQVVSPLTGQIQSCRVEVVGTRHITWDNNPVTTLEVVTKMSPFSARTWVRRDGLVLRQEVPFPFVKLTLERLPESATAVRFAD